MQGFGTKNIVDTNKLLLYIEAEIELLSEVIKPSTVKDHLAGVFCNKLGN
jgi:hypothetical protein